MEVGIRPLSRFEYLAPQSLSSALDLLKEYGDGASLIAGGTDLIVWMKKHIVSPDVLIDINKISELSFIKVKGDFLHIGAATRFSSIKESPLVQENAPLLAEAIGFLASYPIRNRATIGGNLCSASPAADSAPPLLALNAKMLCFALFALAQASQPPKEERASTSFAQAEDGDLPLTAIVQA